MMTSSKSTKRALISSALAILMCVAMLIGTTFAWFTDTASTAVNKIQAGNLDVKLEYATAWNEDGSVKTWADAEGKPLPNVALRAGYGFAGSMLRNPKEWYYNTPLTYQTTCYSAGVGFAIGGFTIDLAYQYLDTKNTSYYLYYALDAAGVMDTASPVYSTDYTRHYAILTLGYKF